MAALQPNYSAIGAHLQGLADEVALIPNAEPITFLQMKALLDQFENQIMARFDLIPIQLYNSELPNTSPLLYPPGLFRKFMPRTKASLLWLTAKRCQKTAVGLGLPALPQDTPVADQRRQI